MIAVHRQRRSTQGGGARHSLAHATETPRGSTRIMSLGSRRLWAVTASTHRRGGSQRKRRCPFCVPHAVDVLTRLGTWRACQAIDVASDGPADVEASGGQRRRVPARRRGWPLITRRVPAQRHLANQIQRQRELGRGRLGDDDAISSRRTALCARP
jgi:hypothetical protein